MPQITNPTPNSKVIPAKKKYTVKTIAYAKQAKLSIIKAPWNSFKITQKCLVKTNQMEK